MNTVITSSGGLELLSEADTIIIPGWRAPDAPAPQSLLVALQDAHARGSRLVSICGGAFVLAQSGLLAGKRATTHWHHVGRLAQGYPDITVEPGVLYVDEGSILTSAGSAAGLDLCIHVVRRDFGARAANSVARRLVVPAHRDGGQAQFIERPVPRRAGTKLSAVLETIRGLLSESRPVERMASEAGMSVRSFHRHIHDATGMAPGEWLRSERLAHARDLLEETTLSIEEIAVHAGFGTATNFRHHFRTALGLSSTIYRSRFGKEMGDQWASSNITSRINSAVSPRRPRRRSVAKRASGMASAVAATAISVNAEKIMREIRPASSRIVSTANSITHFACISAPRRNPSRQPNPTMRAGRVGEWHCKVMYQQTH
jgi:AraC family transcriptional activator FtrA